MSDKIGQLMMVPTDFALGLRATKSLYGRDIITVPANTLVVYLGYEGGLHKYLWGEQIFYTRAFLDHWNES